MLELGLSGYILMTELEFGTVRQVNLIHASGTQNRAFRIPAFLWHVKRKRYGQHRIQLCRPSGRTSHDGLQRQGQGVPVFRLGNIEIRDIARREQQRAVMER